MSFGIHPFVFVAAVGAVLSLIAIVIACMARSDALKGTMIFLALVFLVPAAYMLLASRPEVIDGRFKTYKEFYRDIQIGMTKEEVFAALDRRYPKAGPRQRPKMIDETPESLGFFMNPETSREPNCEGIFLTLEKGRVVRKDYSRD